MMHQIDWVIIILILTAFGLFILGMIDKMIKKNNAHIRNFYENILDANHDLLKEFDKIHDMFFSIENDLNILMNRELEKKSKSRIAIKKISSDKN